MKRTRFCSLFVAAVCLFIGPFTPAQQPRANTLHIGYVYPAGGQQGSTLEVVIGGQFMAGVTNVHVSGGGVQAIITEVIRPISGKELNELRIKIDELLARKAVVRNDFKALEQFRSFKNTKDIKKNSENDDKEIEALKKKYAGATWTAEDEKMLMELRRKIASGVRRPANPAISEIAVCKMTIAPDATPGRRELRVSTPNGLSNPLVFEIGQVTEFMLPASKSIAEQKSSVAKTAFGPKNTKKTEQLVTIPAVINGQILPGGVNHHRFTAKKGQRLVIAVSARSLIPYLADAVPGWFQATVALFDTNGRELAYADDFRFNPDPVLYYEIPADGEYVIEIKDSIYRGREDFVYRITVGELPFITSLFPLGGPVGAETAVELKGWNLPTDRLVLDNKNIAPGIRPVSVRKDNWVSNVMPFAVDTLPECLEKEPNNQPNSAQRVTLPIIINGRIDSPGDADVFCFDGKAGQTVVAEVMARRLNSPLDSILKLTDASGKPIASNDDHVDKGSGLNTHHADSYLSVTLPADGTYYLSLRDTQTKGGPEYAYRLRISPPRPDFELRLVPSSLAARPGSSIPVTVYALRRDGFDGEIKLSLKNAPEGFKLSGGTISSQSDQAKFTLSVPYVPSKGEPRQLQLEGTATIQGQTVTRPVVPADDMMQAFEYRHLVPAQELDVAVLGGGSRFQPKTEVGRVTLKAVGAVAASMKVEADNPLKIPTGGAIPLRVSMAKAPEFVKIQFELEDPPAGIAIQKITPARDGVELLLSCDPDKVKPGQKGNLVVASFVQRARPADKNASTGPVRLPLKTLPAVPYEIVAGP